MSTYTHTDHNGDTLKVYPSYSLPDAVTVTVEELDAGNIASVAVSKADVPRVALELLKKAGYKETDFACDSTVKQAAGWAIRWLQLAADRTEAEVAREAEAEAADKARLDQEALVLAQSTYGPKYEDFPHDTARDYWRNVALAARELHKDGTK